MHPGRLTEVFDQPAPFPGDAGEAALRVDGHRETDGLEQGEVACRIGVGHRLAKVQVVSCSVVHESLVASLSGRWHGGELAVVGAVNDAQFCAHDLVE